ncbi:hypothetical protein EXS89_01715 [Helicobacter pylori]|nr:hypothetical protein [Helicobacter pylori]
MCLFSPSLPKTSTSNKSNKSLDSNCFKNSKSLSYLYAILFLYIVLSPIKNKRLFALHRCSSKVVTDFNIICLKLHLIKKA